jgi:serine protease DegQ
LTPQVSNAVGSKPGHGAVVLEVAPDSPAAKAGLRPGDVVLSVNGRAVRSSADLRNQIGLAAVGDPQEFRVLREGKELVFRAKVESSKPATTHRLERVPELHGATVGTLESGGDAEAVAVLDVAQGSAAYQHGLRAGDVIVAANRGKVHTPAELAAVLKRPGRVVLSVVRGDYVFGLVLRD